MSKTDYFAELKAFRYLTLDICKTSKRTLSFHITVDKFHKLLVSPKTILISTFLVNAHYGYLQQIKNGS